MHSIKLGATALITTAAFLGLAILGEGGIKPFFGHRPLVGLFVVTAVLTIAFLFTSGNLNPGKREDRSNRWVLWVFGVLAVLLAWLPAYMDRNDIWTMGGNGIRWLGVALYAVGGVLRLWPVFVLGNRFSGLVAIQHEHQLVTSGIYSVIRHPSYLGMLVIVFGWGLAFRSAVGLILAALTGIPVIARIKSEEALLLKEFGIEYENYRRNTFRLLPGIY